MCFACLQASDLTPPWRVLLGQKVHTHLTDVKAEAQGGPTQCLLPAAGFHGHCSVVRQACCSMGVTPRCSMLTSLTPHPGAASEALRGLVGWARGCFSLLVVGLTGFWDTAPFYFGSSLLDPFIIPSPSVPGQPG